MTRKVLIVTIIWLTAGLTVLGQHTQSTGNKADDNLKSSARVNPSTRAMEFSIPLGSYGGRTGNTLSLALSYSSKVWAMELFNTRYETHSVSGQANYDYESYESTDNTAAFAQKSIAGWTSSLQTVAIIEEYFLYDQFGEVMAGSATNYSSLDEPEDGWSCWLVDMRHGPITTEFCPSGFATFTTERCRNSVDESIIEVEGYECSFGGPGPGPTPIPGGPIPRRPNAVQRVRLQLPDGSSHEFRKSDQTHDCIDTPSACDGTVTGTFLSVDGSAMRFVKGETQPGGQVRDVLYLPSGGKYYFQVQPVSGQFYRLADRFADANGNSITYDVANRTWTDTLGRVIQDPLHSPFSNARPSLGTQQVSLPGMDGEEVTYSITWAKLGNTLEDPVSSQLKYAGEDKCTSVMPNPVSGDALFTNQEIGPLDDEAINRVLWHYRKRTCASNWGAQVLFDPIVMSEITLPDGAKYKFKYNEYAEISKIINPTGGYERFEYAHVPPMGYTALEIYTQANRGVSKHFVSENGTSETQEWTYGHIADPAGYALKTEAPDGSVSERVLHESNGSGWGFEDPRNGMVKEERVKDTNGAIVSRTINEWTVRGPQGTGAYSEAKRDPRLERSLSIQFEPNSNSALATLTVNEFDDVGSSDPEFFSHLNIKRKKAYHYAVLNKSQVDDEQLSWTTIASWFPDSKLASATETDYSYDAGYKARGIIGLPIETRVMNPVSLSWPALAKSQTIYDNALPSSSASYTYSMQTYGMGNSMDCSSDPQAPKICWQNPNGAGGNIDLSYRGLPTTARVWNADTQSWIESHVQYDQFGNPVKARDPVGNEATTEFGSLYKYAYPTKSIAPAPDPTNTHGTNETSTAETTYDFTTGLPLTAKDDFGQIIRTQYDNLLRPIRVYGDNFTAPESQTIYGTPNQTTGQFPSTERFVKVRKQIDAVNWDEATSWFDGLGRTTKTQAKDSQGDVFADTFYDAFGRVERVTNPYRVGETVLWAKTRYDAAGRAVESYAPTELANLGSAQSVGVTSFDFSAVTNFVGTVVTTTDASGRKGRSITNALGQLLRVDEPTGVSSDPDADLGSLASPHQPTIYTFDVKGKMVRVQQGVQNRYFKYNSLGRLIRVSQPEQDPNGALDMSDDYNPTWHWTAGFTYDILGNVLSATDANNVTITNTYDRANRVKTRTYAGEPAGQSTPGVNFFYDGIGLDTTQTFAKGKLTKVENTISQTRYTQFDNFGRLKEMEQRTPVGSETLANATPRVSKYTYNFSGALIEEEYPSGRKVKNEFESDGDLARIFGTANANATERTYANSFTYTPDGRIEKLKLGNGLWENAKFNSRLQVTELALGHGPSAGDLWKLGYEYGELNTDETVNTGKNPGNIAKQTLSFNGLAQPFVQTYKYDSLFRLKEARETNNGDQTWKQVFDYDRYGNRLTHQRYIGTTEIPQTNITHPAIDPATNRFQSGQGYGFDKNGNLITDAESRAFTFNADNKQTKVIQNGQLVGEYFFDGEGRRVKKKVYSGGELAEETVFVYSNGKLIAEYSTAPPPENPTTSYTVTDQLGSPRVIVNALGDVTSRRDFMPFGEQIDPETNYRTDSLKYNFGDNIRQKFTGYQKDNETGLDFAEARMYENRHGRFTAVDPLIASGKSANPQTFNRYIYVLNSPLLLTDPDGLQAATPSGRWYKPVAPDGIRTYRYESVQPNGYEPVTARNKAGDLIGPYSATRYDEISGPDYVLKFNEFGPRKPMPTIDVRNGARGVEVLTHSEQYGWEFARGDGYQALHPATGAVQNAIEPHDVALLLTPFKFGSAARGAGVGNVTTETFYRSMSTEAAVTLERTGRMTAGSETMVTRSLSEAQKYRGVTMRIEVEAGTTQQLSAIGVRNAAAAHPHHSMPLVHSPWKSTNAFFKLENGTLNIGLGDGKALNIFNCNIVGCGRVR